MPVAAPPVFDPMQQFTYDALGRVVTSTDFYGTVTTNTYNTPALSVDVRDFEQVANSGFSGTSSHVGAYATISRDGHGRAFKNNVHLVQGPNGGSGDLTTTVTFESTGQPKVVQQGNYTRTLTNDLLGRLQIQQEPNTGTWVYTYNPEGQLTGLGSRGCGQNVHYDPMGRMIGKSYVPCDGTSPSTPNWTTGDGTAAFYADDGQTGFLTDAYDLAQHTHYGYDSSGRVSTLTTYVATPTGSATLGARYAPHAFTKQIKQYSLQDRVLSETTGADALELLANGGSAVSYGYTLDGRVASIGSSYGSVLQSAVYNDARGLITNQTFGDAAQTSADFIYDHNGRLGCTR